MAGIVPYVLDRMNNLTLRCATLCLSFRYLNFCLEMGERRFALGQGVELIVFFHRLPTGRSIVFPGVDALPCGRRRDLAVSRSGRSSASKRYLVEGSPVRRRFNIWLA